MLVTVACHCLQQKKRVDFKCTYLVSYYRGFTNKKLSATNISCMQFSRVVFSNSQYVLMLMKLKIFASYNTYEHRFKLLSRKLVNCFELGLYFLDSVTIITIILTSLYSWDPSNTCGKVFRINAKILVRCIISKTSIRRKDNICQS